MKSPMSGSRLAAYILLPGWLVEFVGLLLRFHGVQWVCETPGSKVP